jgi:hypothetical protein
MVLNIFSILKSHLPSTLGKTALPCEQNHPMSPMPALQPQPDPEQEALDWFSRLRQPGCDDTLRQAFAPGARTHSTPGPMPSSKLTGSNCRCRLPGHGRGSPRPAAAAAGCIWR